MATVNELIEQLNEIEDKDQPIAFQYYLKEHLEQNFGGAEGRNLDADVEIIHDWLMNFWETICEDDPIQYYEDYGYEEVN